MAKAKGAHVWVRDPNDWYVEDRACIDFLLDRESFHGFVLDPACGVGNIVKACLDRGIVALGTDLIRRTYGWPEWFGGVRDFLDDTTPETLADAVICNPPYYRAKGAEAFIRRALALPSVQKLAVVVNAKFLFGDGRGNGLFADHPPSRVWPIFPRPSMPTGEWVYQLGNKPGGGTEDFAWLVWDRSACGSQILWSQEVI